MTRSESELNAEYLVTHGNFLKTYFLPIPLTVRTILELAVSNIYILSCDRFGSKEVKGKLLFITLNKLQSRCLTYRSTAGVILGPQHLPLVEVKPHTEVTGCDYTPNLLTTRPPWISFTLNTPLASTQDAARGLNCSCLHQEVMFLGAFVCLSVFMITPTVMHGSFLTPFFLWVKPYQRKK